MSGRVLVTIRFRSDAPDAVRAWGVGADLADALLYLARHPLIILDGPAFDEPILMRVYVGARAERRLAALEPKAEL
jgi:hypothetical protein